MQFLWIKLACQTAIICVEEMNSKRQEKKKTWSRSINRSLPFVVNAILNLKKLRQDIYQSSNSEHITKVSKTIKEGTDSGQSWRLKRIAIAIAVFDLLALLFFKVQFWHLKRLIQCFGRGTSFIYEAVVLLFTSNFLANVKFLQWFCYKLLWWVLGLILWTNHESQSRIIESQFKKQ